MRKPILSKKILGFLENDNSADEIKNYCHSHCHELRRVVRKDGQPFSKEDGEYFRNWMFPMWAGVVNSMEEKMKSEDLHFPLAEPQLPDDTKKKTESKS